MGLLILTFFLVLGLERNKLKLTSQLEDKVKGTYKIKQEVSDNWKLDVRSKFANFFTDFNKMLCAYFYDKISIIGICSFPKKEKNKSPKVYDNNYLSKILYIFQRLDSPMLVLQENECFQGRRLSPCIYPMLLASLTNLFQKYSNMNHELSVKICRFRILNVNKVVCRE